MAVIIAVLFAVETQHIVKPKLGAQHCCHLAGDDARGLWTNQAHIFAGHATEVASVVESAGQKVFVLA